MENKTKLKLPAAPTAGSVLRFDKLLGMRSLLRSKPNPDLRLMDHDIRDVIEFVDLLIDLLPNLHAESKKPHFFSEKKRGFYFHAMPASIKGVWFV